MYCRVGTKGPDSHMAWTDWLSFGRDSGCTQPKMEEYTEVIPWRLMFEGTDEEAVVADNDFGLDLFQLQDSICSFYKVPNCPKLIRPCSVDQTSD